MLARKTSAEVQGDNPIKQAFDAWRRTLWRVHTGAIVRAEVLADELDGIRSGSNASFHRPWILVLGITCLFAGGAARALYQPGRLSAEAILFGAGIVGWAVVRRVLLGYLAKRDGGELVAVNAAWSLGLIPLAASLNVFASAGAWLTSGAITSIALGRFMGSGRAWRIVSRVWLIQLSLYVAATILYWLALNMLAALFA